MLVQRTQIKRLSSITRTIASTLSQNERFNLEWSSVTDQVMPELAKQCVPHIFICLTSHLYALYTFSFEYSPINYSFDLLLRVRGAYAESC